MDYNKNFGYGGNNQLLNTIKLPRNMSEINQKLPKTKKYVEPTGLTMHKGKKTIEESESNPVLNDYNRKVPREAEHASHGVNTKKEGALVRPSSAKYEPRSKTPGVVSNVSRREVLNNSNSNSNQTNQYSNVSTNANSNNSLQKDSNTNSNKKVGMINLIPSSNRVIPSSNLKK
jgi:hypothetical protein